MTPDQKRDQVAQQCRCVVQMASVLANMHTTYADLVASGGMDPSLDDVGRGSADLMNLLQDFLEKEGLADAEADEWMKPVFAEARNLYPAS